MRIDQHTMNSRPGKKCPAKKKSRTDRNQRAIQGYGAEAADNDRRIAGSAASKLAVPGGDAASQPQHRDWLNRRQGDIIIA